MSWCPDTARIKKKMLYSSSFDALKKALVGVHKYIQVSWSWIMLVKGQLISKCPFGVDKATKKATEFL